METVKFEELGLYPQLLRAIKEMGFEEATPIQSQAIPVVMSGVDVIGQAQTGTGKTASFGIPLLMKVDPNNKKTQAIVLSPTRELAIQSAEEIRKLAKYMHGIKVLPIYGGQDISRQIKALKGGATIIIGTPGRVMDHLRRKTIRCDYINTIVLDEADEMLNMGFREDIETILSYIPDEDRQTVLFSATMPKPILEITRKFQHDATTIKVTKKELTVPNIDQYYYDVRRNDKMEVLTRLLDYYNPKLSLVFCNTKRMVDELASELQGRGYAAEGIHGDMKQVQRDRVMKKFRNGKTDILIATDVAARGIDGMMLKRYSTMICRRTMNIMCTGSEEPDAPAVPEKRLISLRARKYTNSKRSSAIARQRSRRSQSHLRMMWQRSRRIRFLTASDRLSRTEICAI